MIARRGALLALRNTARAIEALPAIVVRGVADGTISMPETPEELARLLNRWIMAAQGIVDEHATHHERILLREGAALVQEGNVIQFPAPVRGKIRRKRA